MIIIIFIFIARLFFWDDFKLSLVRYWWLFTITNNPILKEYDEDLKVAKNTKKLPRINLDDLLSGGPPKDGIPALLYPEFVQVSDTEFRDNDLIVGVYLNWEARAYPYWILNWHEIINDTIWDTPISVTLCPLCDTNGVFIREVNGKETTFWVSWKLYQSCLVMYDRLTDTMWSQPWGQWIVWEQVNDFLEKVPAIKTTLWKWRGKYPDTLVVSSETWHSRDYFRYPYWTYYTNEQLIFPVRNQEELKIHPKEIVSYIWQTDDKTPQWIFSGDSFQIVHKELKDAWEIKIKYLWKDVLIKWDDDFEVARFFDWINEIPSSTAFGFVYPAFFE